MTVRDQKSNTSQNTLGWHPPTHTHNLFINTENLHKIDYEMSSWKQGNQQQSEDFVMRKSQLLNFPSYGYFPYVQNYACLSGRLNPYIDSELEIKVYLLGLKNKLSHTTEMEYVCMSMYAISEGLHICVFMYVCVCACMFVCVHMCVFMCVYVCVYVVI